MQPLSSRSRQSMSIAGLLSAQILSPQVFAEEIAVDETHVITATSYEKTLSNAPASVSVITNEQLQTMPYNNLSDALVNTVGVNIADIGLGQKGIEIRGMDTSQTLILINGRRTNRASDLIGHANLDLKNIPVSDIERIEVIKGPMSALYGSDALGGVVNVITKSMSNEWQSIVSAHGGSTTSEGDNRFNGEVQTSGALVEDKLYMKLSAGSYYQGLIENRNDATETDISGNRNQYVDTQFKGVISDSQELDVSLRYGQQQTWYDYVVSSGTAAGQLTRSTSSYDTLDYSVTHSGYWDNFDTQISIYGSSVDQSNHQTVGDSSTTNTVTENIIEGQGQFYVGQHQITLGGQWRHQDLESADLSTGGDSMSQGALFAQGDFKITETVSFLAGARIDEHSEFGENISPRAYLVYSPTENWTIKGGYGEGYKAPTIKQLSPDYLSIGSGRPFDIIGNVDLKPEENQSYEISVEYQADRWSTGLTLFQNNVENLIVTQCVENCQGRPTAGFTKYQYMNVDEADIKGLEWQGHLDITQSLFIDLNMTLLDAKEAQTGEKIENKPESQAYVGLNWQATDTISTLVSARHVGKQTYESSTLPSYQVYNLAAKYHSGDFFGSVGINNILDTYLQDESALFTYAIQPREVYFRAEYKF
ncbi:TonB-dependent receptor domain-containing protein [Vibrio ezurae]|uniref:Putative TonB-dependent receptor n=1 Tax=Vibrio ezurae NBRC 102218 TaxID=1219080 RepID=U3B0T2_9VIBR|nr:TonB-dependent receptor [Vibrio ezurae]GAD79580.1 putative TonB-dependent receptor [Vibrio ezurae NBRC 102218]